MHEHEDISMHGQLRSRNHYQCFLMHGQELIAMRNGQSRQLYVSSTRECYGNIAQQQKKYQQNKYKQQKTHQKQQRDKQQKQYMQEQQQQKQQRISATITQNVAPTQKQPPQQQHPPLCYHHGNTCCYVVGCHGYQLLPWLLLLGTSVGRYRVPTLPTSSMIWFRSS